MEFDTHPVVALHGEFLMEVEGYVISKDRRDDDLLVYRKDRKNEPLWYFGTSGGSMGDGSPIMHHHAELLAPAPPLPPLVIIEMYRLYKELNSD